ncbi:MAG: RDD family protein [Acidimicrobiia bacterium]
MIVAPVAGWYRDPSGRFELRYWDGRGWSEHVASYGAMYVDPPRPTSTPVATATSATTFAPAPELPLATLGQRFGAYCLDVLLMVVTLVVGWLVWSCVTFSKGQSPAKAILGHRVVRQDTGQAAPWGDMFLRNVILQFGLTLLSIVTLGLPLLIGGGLILAGDLRQTAWDRLAGTRVVLDPQGRSLPQSASYRY